MVYTRAHAFLMHDGGQEILPLFCSQNVISHYTRWLFLLIYFI